MNLSLSKTITNILNKSDENASNHPKVMSFILKIEATLDNGDLENRDSASQELYSWASGQIRKRNKDHEYHGRPR